MSNITSKPATSGTTIQKARVLETISMAQKSSLQRYRDFFVGRPGLPALIQYELAVFLAAPMPGALGYLLRKWFFRRACGTVGQGVQFGRNVALRHPHKIEIGSGTAIDDDCTLDARGVEPGEFRIGKNVLIARNCILQSKTDIAFIEIGDECTIGSQCNIGSSGGIRIGRAVGIASHCFIGGARYRIDHLDVPVIQQELYTNGPIEIDDGCLIGAGVRIVDGVRIGRGVVIGAGASVQEDVPDYMIVAGAPAAIVCSREELTEA